MAEEARDGGEQLAAIGVILLILGFVVWFHFPKNTVSKRSPKLVEWSKIKNLTLACRAYAADWDGQYPNRLTDLYPDYLNDQQQLKARNLKGAESNFIYYPGQTDTSHSRLPLIKHPFIFDGNRITGWTGGHVTRDRVQTP